MATNIPSVGFNTLNEVMDEDGSITEGMVIILAKHPSPVIKAGKSKRTGKPYSMTELAAGLFNQVFEDADGNQFSVTASVLEPKNATKKVGSSFAS